MVRTETTRVFPGDFEKMKDIVPAERLEKLREKKAKTDLMRASKIYGEWFNKLIYTRKAKHSYFIGDYKNAAETILTTLEATKLRAISAVLESEIEWSSAKTRRLIATARAILGEGEEIFTRASTDYKKGEYQASCLIMFRFFNKRRLREITKTIEAVVADIGKEYSKIEDSLTKLRKEMGDLMKEIDESHEVT